MQRGKQNNVHWEPADVEDHNEVVDWALVERAAVQRKAEALAEERRAPESLADRLKHKLFPKK